MDLNYPFSQEGYDAFYFRVATVSLKEKNWELSQLTSISKKKIMEIDCYVKKGIIITSYLDYKDPTKYEMMKDELEIALSSPNITKKTKSISRFHLGFANYHLYGKGEKEFEDLARNNEPYGFYGLTFYEKDNEKKLNLARKAVNLSKRGSYIHHMSLLLLGGIILPESCQSMSQKRENLGIYEEALRFCPKQPKINSYIAVYHQIVGNLEKALEYYQRETKTQTEPAVLKMCHIESSRILFFHRKNEEALVEINKAISLPENRHEFNKNDIHSVYFQYFSNYIKGKILVRLKRYKEAIENLILPLEGKLDHRKCFMFSLKFFQERYIDAKRPNMIRLYGYGPAYLYSKIFRKYFNKMIKIKFNFMEKRKKERHESNCRLYEDKIVGKMKRWEKRRIFRDDERYGDVLKFMGDYRSEKDIKNDLRERIEYVFQNFETSKFLDLYQNDKVIIVPSFFKRFEIL